MKISPTTLTLLDSFDKKEPTEFQENEEDQTQNPNLLLPIRMKWTSSDPTCATILSCLQAGPWPPLSSTLQGPFLGCLNEVPKSTVKTDVELSQPLFALLQAIETVEMISKLLAPQHLINFSTHLELAGLTNAIATTLPALLQLLYQPLRSLHKEWSTNKTRARTNVMSNVASAHLRNTATQQGVHCSGLWSPLQRQGLLTLAEKYAAMPRVGKRRTTINNPPPPKRARIMTRPFRSYPTSAPPSRGSGPPRHYSSANLQLHKSGAPLYLLL